jgi:hypothetical protein
MGIEVAAADAPHDLKKRVRFPSANPWLVLFWSNHRAGMETRPCYRSAAIFSLPELIEQAVGIDRRNRPRRANQVRAKFRQLICLI